MVDRSPDPGRCSHGAMTVGAAIALGGALVGFAAGYFVARGGSEKTVTVADTPAMERWMDEPFGPAGGLAPKPAPPPTAAPSPPQAPTPAPAPPPPDPRVQAKHDAELDRWIKRLKDEDPGVSFSATYKLKDLRDLRAVVPLVETLRTHKDYYTRLGAATALGELRACDAVPALIEALDDRESLVQTAAGEALVTITDHDTRLDPGAGGAKRRAVELEWTAWWRDNESSVRQRLGQAK